MTQHPSFVPGRVAVVTGGASGIGLAAARRFADMGLKVVIADRPGETLDAARAEFAGKGEAAEVDVSVPEDLARLKEVAYGLGDVAVLMNNAGVGGGGLKPWTGPESWMRTLGVNFFGVLNGVQAFVPEMIGRGLPGLVINTGSKQGITTPPGDAAYNVSKAGVKVLTEQLSHELRAAAPQMSAALLVPGHTFTGMTARGRSEPPPSAWTADQVVDYLLESLERGDFYILCPDNDVTRRMDEKRIAWAAGDLIENRPALSRWHPDYAEAFATYMARD
jgi:NAD(P)-dependent dehydrogenase (short-subunit alcohol dehydrogenase family)